jgi:hypothetical protein
MADVRWSVIHHSNAGLTRPRVEAVTRYQTGGNSHLPFPGIAYHIYVEGDGRLAVCWDLEVVTWGQGAGSPYSNLDVGIYNWWGIAICFAGDAPNASQLATLVRILGAVDNVMGRKLDRQPHRGVSVDADTGETLTECPGDRYIAWWPVVRDGM